MSLSLSSLSPLFKELAFASHWGWSSRRHRRVGPEDLAKFHLGAGVVQARGVEQDSPTYGTPALIYEEIPSRFPGPDPHDDSDPTHQTAGLLLQ
jgi:hypothetical protein